MRSPHNPFAARNDLRHKTWRLMNDPAFPGKRRFDFFIYVLILFSAAFVVYEAFWEPPPRVHGALLRLDNVILGIFLVEYLLRLLVVDSGLPEAVELNAFQKLYYAAMARLRWAVTPMALIDLAALLPLFPFLRSLRVLRALRLFRLVRIFALNELLRNLSAAVRDNFLLYAVASSFVVATVLAGSVGIFLVEGKTNPNITSPWDAFWWTAVTLSTVGYGDTVPHTTGGRMVAIGLMFAGMCILAVFAGVISQTLVGYLLDVREERVRMSAVVNQVVVCGWNPRGQMVVEELTRLEPDREVVVLAHRERLEGLPDDVNFIRGEPTKEAELDKVRMSQCRSVIVLADEASESLPAADGSSALIVYTVRSYEAKLKERGIERHTPIHVCAELMDPENFEHLVRAGADEVVHTAQIGSNLVAHSSARPGMGKVFTELLSWWGQQVDISPVPQDLELPATFLDVSLELREKGNFLLLGLLRSKGDVCLNPRPGTQVEAEDRLIFMREGGARPD